jgi:hypothetical protein
VLFYRNEFFFSQKVKAKTSLKGSHRSVSRPFSTRVALYLNWTEIDNRTDSVSHWSMSCKPHLGDEESRIDSNVRFPKGCGMVVHQTVRMDDGIIFFRGRFEVWKEFCVIYFVRMDCLPFIFPSGHMVERPRILDSKRSGHKLNPSPNNSRTSVPNEFQNVKCDDPVKSQ